MFQTTMMQNPVYLNQQKPILRKQKLKSVQETAFSANLLEQIGVPAQALFGQLT